MNYQTIFVVHARFVEHCHLRSEMGTVVPAEINFLNTTHLEEGTALALDIKIKVENVGNVI